MVNKTTSVCDLISSENLDILGITESWMTGLPSDNIVTSCIKDTLPGYDILYVPRLVRSGGGLCLIHKASITMTKKITHSYKTFESIDVTMSCGTSTLRIA